MESFSDKLMYSKVAESIRDNIEDINKLLENCAITSRISTEEEKIYNFFSTDTEKFVNCFAKPEYYDLDQVSKIFEMLESAKPESKKKPKLNLRSDSVSSLASSSGQSSEDVSQLHDNKSEVQIHLTEIRTILESISNSVIKVPDMNSIKSKETANHTSFVDTVMSLQKLAKELQNIALSDNAGEEQETFNIDEKFVTDLTHLSQVGSMKLRWLKRKLINFFLDTRWHSSLQQESHRSSTKTGKLLLSVDKRRERCSRSHWEKPSLSDNAKCQILCRKYNQLEY